MSIDGATFATLNTRQQRLLAVLRRRLDEQQTASVRLDTATTLTGHAVSEALDGSVPAKVVAAEMGLSLSRVYQIRENTTGARRTG